MQKKYWTLFHQKCLFFLLLLPYTFSYFFASLSDVPSIVFFLFFLSFRLSFLSFFYLIALNSFFSSLSFLFLLLPAVDTFLFPFSNCLFLLQAFFPSNTCFLSWNIFFYLRFHKTLPFYFPFCSFVLFCLDLPPFARF